MNMNNKFAFFILLSTLSFYGLFYVVYYYADKNFLIVDINPVYQFFLKLVYLIISYILCCSMFYLYDNHNFDYNLKLLDKIFFGCYILMDLGTYFSLIKNLFI